MDLVSLEIVVLENYVHCTGLRNHNIIIGDVVLNSFNNASRDEDNILHQIYIKQIFSVFYYDG